MDTLYPECDRMYKYDDRSFRYISKEPLKIGQFVITGYNPETRQNIFKEIVEIKEPARKDAGKWL